MIDLNDLNNVKIILCKKDEAPANSEDIKNYLKQLKQWKVISQDNTLKLTRKFKTDNYLKTIQFVNAIATASNSNNHHPALFVEYKSVSVYWHTHTINNLHLNDFVMAKICDALYNKI